MKLLLDTHILIWWVQGELGLLTDQERRVIVDEVGKHELLVSDISLWEIALLVERRRIRLSLPLRDWLEKATAPPLVQRCHLTPAVVSRTLSLPDNFHRDPADRLIVCTALVHQARLATRDHRILSAGLIASL